MTSIRDGTRRRKTRAKSSASWRSIEETLSHLRPRKSNSQLRSIIDNLPGVVYRRVVTADGSVKYPYIDPRLRELCGKGATGKSCNKTLLHRYLHPDDRQFFKNAMDFSAKNMTPVEMDFRLDRATSSDIWLHTVSYPRELANGSIQWDGIALDVTTAKSLQTYLVNHDSLTGLPTRSFYVDWLKQMIRQAKQEQTPLIVVVLELISLENIRESSGHDIGDASIREAAARLQMATKSGDALAYVGSGCFFMALMGNLEEEDFSRPIAAIMRQFEPRFEWDGQDFPLDILMGITTTPADGGNAETLIGQATTALNKTKKTLTQSFRFYDARMTDHAVKRLSIESDLRRAVSRDEFVLHYQPQYDTQTLAIVGSEALIRWRHPDRRRLVPPGEFIPVAEETGVIMQIGEIAIRQACTQALDWQCRGVMEKPISVNLSGYQLAQKDIGDRILTTLLEIGLAPEHLKLELTESTIVRDIDATTRMMRQLGEAGVRFSVDDFGIEHSALSHLNRLPIHELKIDYSFVSRMTTDRIHAALVQAIIVMTHAMNMSVVAEGIEYHRQLTFLQAYQCDAFQGFLLSKPVTAKKFERLIKSAPHGTI